MTTLEAQVAHSENLPSADPAKVSAPPTPAPTPGGVPTISDYEAEKAAFKNALLTKPAATEASPQQVPDDIETQIVRDEFGDQIHDPDKDAEAGLALIPPPDAASDQQALEQQQDERILPNRIPTAQFSRVEQEAMALKHELEKANPGQAFLLKDCLDRVEAKYSAPKPNVPVPNTPEASQIDPSLPQSLAELDAKKRETAQAIRAKRTEIAKAEVELRYEDKLALTEELNELESANETLQDYAPRLASVEEARSQEFTKTYTDSAGKAVNLYPDAQVKGSAFYNRMAEIDALFQETGDPRFHSDNKPLLIAQMVAGEMNVAPRSKGTAKATPNAPQPPVIFQAGTHPTHLAAPVASGSARTTTPTVTQAEAAIAAVRTPEQLENLKMQLLGQRAA